MYIHTMHLSFSLNDRLVCETLLKCEALVYTNEDFWCQSFILIDKIISGVDYKVGAFF